MILDHADDKKTLLSPTEAAPPTQPPTYSAVGPGPSSTTISSSSYLTDTKSATTPSTLPLLLPPLYAPSPSSPFLVAFSPSLETEANAPRLSFLSLVKAVNDSLRPSPLVQGARTAENIITHVPVIGAVYHAVKGIFGGLALGVVKGGAAVVEGGRDGKVTRKLANSQSTLFGSSSSLIPNATHDIINKANSSGGLFPPSSGLLFALVPFSTLSIVLSQYQPLSDLPNPVAAHLVRSNVKASSSDSNLSPETKKALKVRGRLDFTRWAWVTLEDEEDEGSVEAREARQAAEIADAKSDSRPPLPSASSSSGPKVSRIGSFSHVDEKLSAQHARRQATKQTRRDRRRGGGEDDSRGAVWSLGEAGFEIDQGKVGPGTYFLVVVRRGLVGLERFEEEAIY